MPTDLRQSRAPVLVVEDDEGLQTLFTALLARAGFRVECVSDGAQALERLARSAYSAVLLDLMMRGTNGFDVLHCLAETRPALLRRTIVTSGVSERELAKVDRGSVFAVIRKPFDIDFLIATVIACARQKEGGGTGGDPGGEIPLDESVRAAGAAARVLVRRGLQG
jgi:DNA-binding response OmpR family regulator